MSDPAKQAAGVAAVDEVRDGMLLGLGTGSTVAYFLDELAARGLQVTGVPTSEATATRCRELGIELRAPDDAPRLDLCVDGADELTRDLVLTKGGGGALLREKVVAAMSARMVVIATPDKVVDRLGDTFALPVEVVPFARVPVTRWLEDRGFHVEHRGGRTDNGLTILDARLPGGIPDPAALADDLSAVPGVAEHGLFVGLAQRAVLGHPDGSTSEITLP